ncbi:uncharacterized protein ACBT57_024473 [Dama dama]
MAARFEQEVHGVPRAPLATARCSPGVCGPLRPRRRGTHSDPGRPPHPPVSVMTPPPTHTHTLKHAHVPRRPGGGGSAGVSVGCALTSTCVWKTGALPAGVRAEIASSRCHPPPPSSRLFQVHQGTRGLLEGSFPSRLSSPEWSGGAEDPPVPEPCFLDCCR